MELEFELGLSGSKDHILNLCVVMWSQSITILHTLLFAFFFFLWPDQSQLRYCRASQKEAPFWHRLDKDSFWKQTVVPENCFSHVFPVLGPGLTSVVHTVWLISSSTKTRRGIVVPCLLPSSQAPTGEFTADSLFPVCVQSLPLPEGRRLYGSRSH